MKTKTWKEIRKTQTPEIEAETARWVAAELEAMDLRELRKAAGMTQEEVAAALEIAQPEISQLENRTDVHVSRLRNYVEALGGKLRIVADFGVRQVRLRSF